MKRNLALILAAMMLSASMVSCGDDAKTPSETTPETTAPVTQQQTETEPVSQPAVETEPITEAVTEPPVVTVYTPVVRDDFDNADETLWKTNAQMIDFVVADGFLTCTSTGGDPSIATKAKLGIACEDVDCIRIRYINMTSNDRIQLFFTTDTNGSYSEEASFSDYCDYYESEEGSEEWNEVIFYTEDNELWTGTLANLRLDISDGEGNYKVDFISLDKISTEPAN